MLDAIGRQRPNEFMILSGERSEFAIECQYTDAIGNWLYGHLRFIFRNESCGNWDDSVDLRGSVSWLRDFAERPVDRYEAELLTLPPTEVFERIVKPVLAQPDGQEYPEIYSDAYARFHISKLGMSAFDYTTIVLIEDEWRQRCLWNEGSSADIHDVYFKAGTMQAVAKRFCEDLELEVSKFGFHL